MRDGLYRVCWKNVCAGFTIKGGKVEYCAPILRRKLWMWWIKIAKRIGD